MDGAAWCMGVGVALIAQNRARLGGTFSFRDICGYHTVSINAKCTLAGTPQLDLKVELLAEVYRRVAHFRAENGFRPPSVHYGRPVWRLHVLVLLP